MVRVEQQLVGFKQRLAASMSLFSAKYSNDLARVDPGRVIARILRPSTLLQTMISHYAGTHRAEKKRFSRESIFEQTTLLGLGSFIAIITELTLQPCDAGISFFFGTGCQK